MVHPLMENPLTKDIISLMAVSRLSAVEKTLWVRVLPYMKEGELQELKQNLEAEVDYEVKAEDQVVKRFVAALDKGV